MRHSEKPTNSFVDFLINKNRRSVTLILTAASAYFYYSHAVSTCGDFRCVNAYIAKRRCILRRVRLDNEREAVQKSNEKKTNQIMMTNGLNKTTTNDDDDDVLR